MISRRMSASSSDAEWQAFEAEARALMPAEAYCLRPAYVQLCTVDSDFLTRLVFLAHDYGMRVEIEPRTFQHLTLGFWQRETRTGSLSERCPTLEDAVRAYRAEYPTEMEVL